MVEATLKKLDLFKTKNGPELTKRYADLETMKSIYRGVKLTDRQTTVKNAVSKQLN